jgi:hypothetical protein
MMMSASANLGQCYLFAVNRDQTGGLCLVFSVVAWCVRLPSCLNTLFLIIYHLSGQLQQLTFKLALSIFLIF